MKDLWTKSGVRLRLVNSNAGENINWLFFPGGPGFDSDYLLMLTKDLPVPGSIWHVDLPGNGSNTVSDSYHFSSWRACLLEVVQSLPKVIFVGHSFSGLFALLYPELEAKLEGLVLMNSAPRSWAEAAEAIAEKLQLPTLTQERQQYLRERSDYHFKRFVLALADSFFTPDDAEEGRAYMQPFQYSHAPFDWSRGGLFQEYEAQWIPTKIPTLIIGAENDYTVPFHLFKEDKRFKRDNIQQYCIANASHFPWFQKKQEVVNAFVEFSKKFQAVPTHDEQQWLQWIEHLQAIAQNGLTYTKDWFDRERYRQLQDITAEIAADYSSMTFDEVKQLFTEEKGYATPKLEVRAAVFKGDKLLMVQESADNLWSLPGGWADINCSPAESVCREVFEETGFTVEVLRLIALHDKRKHDYRPVLPHTYTCLFLCEIVSGELKTSYETKAVDFFSEEEIPPLSSNRISKKHITLCFSERDKLDKASLFD